MSKNINIKSDRMSCVAHGQAVVEARQPVEGACRLLSVTATPVVTPGEIFAGEARYLGKVKFDCLMFCDGEVKCVSTVCEFSDKVSSPEIGANTSVTLMPETVNVEATVDGGTLKAVAVIDTRAYACSSVEKTCIEQPDDGIYAETEKVDYCTVSAEATEAVYITDSIGANKVTDVLCAYSRAAVTGAEAMPGTVKASGTVYSQIVVRYEDGTIGAIRAVTPFVKDISALGAGEGDIAYAYAMPTETTALLIADENRIDLSVALNVSALSLSCRESTAVSDVFCADNELETSVATLLCRTVEPLVTVTDTVDGQIPLPQERLAADSVLCVGGAFCTVSAEAADGRVNVEGLVGGDIVYYNAENNSAQSLAFRLPFSMPLGMHTDASEVEVTATVTDISVRVRRESVFDVKAEIAFTVKPYADRECKFIENVKLGAPIARPDASVIIHIAKAGETLWQAAKALCCSPERVAEQNAASAPYAGGERLINFCNKR